MVSPLFKSTPLYQYDRPETRRPGPGPSNDTENLNVKPSTKDDIDMTSGSNEEFINRGRHSQTGEGEGEENIKGNVGSRGENEGGDDDVDDAIDELLSDNEPDTSWRKRMRGGRGRGNGRGSRGARGGRAIRGGKVVHEDVGVVDVGQGVEDDARFGGVEGSGTRGSAGCEWEDCLEVCSDPDALAIHLRDVHIPGAKDVEWACMWRGCTRRGQKQSSRNSLATHLRQHTGEKPYRCGEPDCDAAFTRSDGLNKHKRLAHGIGAPVPLTASQARRTELFTNKPNLNLLSLDHSPSVHFSQLPIASADRPALASLTNDGASSSALTTVPAALTSTSPYASGSRGSLAALAGLTMAEQELCEDEDLLDAILRMRERRKMRLYSVNVEENAAVKRMREARDTEARQARIERRKAAQAATSGKGTSTSNMTINGKGSSKSKEKEKDKDSDSDGFDEGVGENYPIDRIIQGVARDPRDHRIEAPIMSLSRGQARYLIAKAKFMLVEEENNMRLDELRFWQEEEDRIIGGSAGVR